MTRQAGQTKRHFIVLDGMRGIAAIAVACLHAIQFFVGDEASIESPALAVDFFFCLSGFIVAYAYADRLESGMSFREFAARRAIRLYPMIFLGALIGSMVLALGALQRGGAGLEIFAVVVGSFLLLPSGLHFGIPAYPANNPLWSLFFECVANAVYAKSPKCAPKLLWSALAVSALGIVVVSIHYNGLDTVGYVDWTSFILGFVRLSYPFLAGVLIYRLGLFDRAFRVPAILVAAALVGSLSIEAQPTWAYHAALSILILPLIVALGANSEPGIWRKGMVWLGEISYPLYLIHQPILRIVNNIPVVSEWGRLHPFIMVVLCVAGSCGLATLVFRFYDEKLRNWAMAAYFRRPRTVATS